jgi:hypothetical protein
MRRFLDNLVRNFRSIDAIRSPRRTPRRASLCVEGLEDRMVLSTATQVGSTLLVTADPGSFILSGIGHLGFRHIRPISFQADQTDHAKLDVFDSGTLLGKFAISSIAAVNVSVAGLDAVNIDDSRGMPFAAGTNVSLFGSGSFNSLNLTGSRVISGGETYAAGHGSLAGSLKLGGVTFGFNSAIGSVTDKIETTAPLFVQSFGTDVSLSGVDGGTQTLSGLAASGGGGGTLTYSNKNMVELDKFTFAKVNLNATAAAAGEQFFVVGMHANNQQLFINETPSNVTTSVVAAGNNALVELLANSGRVSIAGTSSTAVFVGNVPGGRFTTAGIKQDVFVRGGFLSVDNIGNHATQEHVTVTESTISGTGLFGNDAVTLHYSDTTDLEITTGHLANTYTVIGSRPGATFSGPINIHGASDVGLNVLVVLDSRSGLSLGLDNEYGSSSAPVSLFISVLSGTFSKPTPNLPADVEIVTFAGGLTSDIGYVDFTSVTHS